MAGLPSDIRTRGQDNGLTSTTAFIESTGIMARRLRDGSLHGTVYMKPAESGDSGSMQRLWHPCNFGDCWPDKPGTVRTDVFY